MEYPWSTTAGLISYNRLGAELYLNNENDYHIVDDNGNQLKDSFNPINDNIMGEIDMIIADVHEVKTRTSQPLATGLHNPSGYKMVADRDFAMGDIILSEPHFINTDEPIDSFTELYTFLTFLKEILLHPFNLESLSLLTPYRNVVRGEIKMNRVDAIVTTLYMNNFRGLREGFYIDFASSFINHSCNPNCYKRTIEVETPKSMAQIIAAMPINKGGEITISYTCVEAIKSGRLQRDHLEETYSIDCNCGKCLDMSATTVMDRQVECERKYRPGGISIVSDRLQSDDRTEDPIEEKLRQILAIARSIILPSHIKLDRMPPPSF